jgi:hypothetical protein
MVDSDTTIGFKFADCKFGWVAEGEDGGMFGRGRNIYIQKN